MTASLTKLLLAIDGSREAALAVRAAADVSRTTGAELHVVHVFPDVSSPSRLDSTMFADYARQAEEEARDLLRKLAWSARVDGGEVSGEYLRVGKLAQEVNALATRLDVDLVIVGSPRAGWLKRLLAGSVAEDLVHGASCPVLIMRGGVGAWPPARIVVGDDGSEAAGRAGILAAEIAGLYGIEVLLVQAYENPPEPVGGRSAQDRRELDEALSRRREDLEGRAEQVAALTQRRIGTRLIESKAVRAVSLIAGRREGESTLLAVGGRGLGALDRVLAGSVSTGVLRAATGPVLVVPSEATSRQADMSRYARGLVGPA
jgi:nucleotide-binding universal stress UspA family protein